MTSELFWEDEQSTILINRGSGEGIPVREKSEAERIEKNYLGIVLGEEICTGMVEGGAGFGLGTRFEC